MLIPPENFGFPLGFLWVSSGFLPGAVLPGFHWKSRRGVDSPRKFWVSFRVSFGFPAVSFPVGFRWVSFPVGFLWVSFGFPLGFLWVSFGVLSGAALPWFHWKS